MLNWGSFAVAMIYVIISACVRLANGRKLLCAWVFCAHEAKIRDKCITHESNALRRNVGSSLLITLRERQLFGDRCLILVNSNIYMYVLLNCLH